MFVIYTGPFAGVNTPDGTLFEKDQAVEVSDVTGKALIAQGFAQPHPPTFSKGNK